MLDQLAYLRSAQTGRASSWEETGRNSDAGGSNPVRAQSSPTSKAPAASPTCG